MRRRKNDCRALRCSANRRPTRDGFGSGVVTVVHAMSPHPALLAPPVRIGNHAPARAAFPNWRRRREVASRPEAVVPELPLSECLICSFASPPRRARTGAALVRDRCSCVPGAFPSMRNRAKTSKGRMTHGRECRGVWPLGSAQPPTRYLNSSAEESTTFAIWHPLP
jgi:hypothetical protein